MTKVDYDERLHAVYRQARALPQRSMDAWCDAFERRFPPHRPLDLADVGCGVGRFTPALAERLGGQVTGIEPSAKMREVAAVDAAHARVTYVAGSAEDLPLPDGSVDGALLFFVWHHVVDRASAARELARVVRPDGVLLMRTQLPERMPRCWWHDAYPRALEVETAMFEPLATTVETLAAAGWSHVATDDVDYEVAPSKAAYLDRLKLRGISTFEHLTERETDELFAALEATVAADGDPQPVIETATLLTFTRASAG